MLNRRKRAPNVLLRDWKLRLENAAAVADAVAAEVVVHPISVRAAGAVEEATLVVLVTERQDLGRCALRGRQKWARRRRRTDRRRRRGSR